MGKDYPKEWREKKQSVAAKYGFKCAYCGCDVTVDDVHLDHIIPRIEFRHNFAKYYKMGIREDSLSNLNPSCSSCNNSKGICTIEQFRDRLEIIIDRLRRDTPHFRIAERYGMLTVHPKKIIFYFETFKDNG